MEKGYAETRLGGSPPRYSGVHSPLAEALEALIGALPPMPMEGICNSNELDENEGMMLEEWCCQNARPRWATGSGLLEAAELIVERAIENANI